MGTEFGKQDGPAARGSAPIDLSSLLARCLGDIDRLSDMLQTCLDDSAVRLADLEHQLEAGDFRAVQQSAQSIRGSAGNISARQLSLFAEQIESLSRAGDMDAAETFFPMLREELDTCISMVPGLLDAAQKSSSPKRAA